MKILSIYCFCFMSLLPLKVLGNTENENASIFPIVEPMQWINENYLQIQRTHIDEIARDNFAKPFRGNISDLALLQRFVDTQVIDTKDKKSLQALGVILGDIYVKEYKHLEWAVYEDELGRSHAVCVKNTKECLFVTTLLSKRMEVGLKPKVHKLYKKNFDEIKQFFPKRAYNPY